MKTVASSVRLLFSLLLFLQAGGCSKTPTTAVEAENGTAGMPRLKVILQTDWYPQPEHAGFYLAGINGYYSDAGLDVEIRPGGNAAAVPQLVATGRVQLGIGTSDNLLVAQSRGIPLIGLFPYFQHDPQCVMFHRSSGIRTLADLDGRTVMVNPGAAYVAYLQQTLGIRIQLVPMDYSLARFLADPDFVQQCFVTSEPWYVAQKGVDPGVLPLSSSGFDPYRLVYGNTQFVAEHPEQVRAFIAASLRGWQDYAAGEEAASSVHRVILSRNAEQTMEHMTWTRAQMRAHRLIEGDATRGEGLGILSRSRIERLHEQLDKLGLLEGPVQPESGFALDLLPEGLLVE